EHVEVIANLLRVLVGVDAEVAEVAPLPAERNVKVDAQRHARNWGQLERGTSVDGNSFRAPRRERWIRGNEITADFSRIGQGRRGAIDHSETTIYRAALHCSPLVFAGLGPISIWQGRRFRG